MRHSKVIIALLFVSLFALTMQSCRDGGPKNRPDAPEELKPDHLMIQEIFYFGTWHPNRGKIGKMDTGYKYEYDQYIKIVNPTSETIYLDNYALALSAIDSNDVFRTLTPSNFFNDHVLLSTVLKFPGNGKETPIKPGATILLAAVAANHTADSGDPNNEEEHYLGNPNSFDFSKGVDFVWLTPEQASVFGAKMFVGRMTKTPNLLPIFNLDENWDNSFDSSKGSLLNLTQYSTVMLIELQKPVADLKQKEYVGTIHYTGSHSGDRKGLKIPNKWVTDAVRICYKGDKQVDVVSATLDKGCQWVEKHGQSLIREHNGKNWVDNNNSTVDFKAKPASEAKKK